MRIRSVVLKLWFAFTLLILLVMVPLEFALHRLLMDFYSNQVTEPLLYHSEQFAQKETGQVILIKSDLRDVVAAIEIARATMNKVYQNLFWALVYNSIGIPVAAGLLYPWTGLVVSPELAGLFPSISLR